MDTSFAGVDRTPKGLAAMENFFLKADVWSPPLGFTPPSMTRPNPSPWWYKGLRKDKDFKVMNTPTGLAEILQQSEPFKLSFPPVFVPTAPCGSLVDIH